MIHNYIKGILESAKINKDSFSVLYKLQTHYRFSTILEESVELYCK